MRSTRYADRAPRAEQRARQILRRRTSTVHASAAKVDRLAGPAVAVTGARAARSTRPSPCAGPSEEEQARPARDRKNVCPACTTASMRSKPSVPICLSASRGLTAKIKDSATVTAMSSQVPAAAGAPNYRTPRQHRPCDGPSTQRRLPGAHQRVRQRSPAEHREPGGQEPEYQPQHRRYADVTDGQTRRGHRGFEGLAGRPTRQGPGLTPL
jgi:hypothetical protein